MLWNGMAWYIMYIMYNIVYILYLCSCLYGINAKWLCMPMNYGRQWAYVLRNSAATFKHNSRMSGSEPFCWACVCICMTKMPKDWNREGETPVDAIPLCMSVVLLAAAPSSCQTFPPWAFVSTQPFTIPPSRQNALLHFTPYLLIFHTRKNGCCHPSIMHKRWWI